MGKRIAIIQGHPDPAPERFGRALAEAYARGAAAAGHEVRVIEVGALDFPLLRGRQDWERGPPAEAIRQAQETIAWAGHLLIIYPLWLGSMPALLKAFLEQVMRPGFAIARPEEGGMGRKLLAGRSARIVVTMGMPALLYRWYFRAHSLRSLERNILRFCGIGPIRETLIGMVEAGAAARRERWLDRMRDLGRAGA
ncbi:MAG: NAD(P)H-dependent oxidoreductase [Gammaproteobacteria bacterium]|nr:NAD(P)H-dependent oxidoreductase [Gammaproteobacteria bacterium]